MEQHLLAKKIRAFIRLSKHMPHPNLHEPDHKLFLQKHNNWCGYSGHTFWPLAFVLMQLSFCLISVSQRGEEQFFDVGQRKVAKDQRPESMSRVPTIGKKKPMKFLKVYIYGGAKT